MIQKLLGRGLLFYISMLLVTFFLDPDVRFDSIWAAIMVTVLLSTANVFIQPMLKAASLPMSTLTLGLFPAAANVIIIFLISDWVAGFHVGGIFWAFLFSALVSGVFSGLLWLMTTYTDFDAKT
ncbi:MAG: phage holin family protein [Cytophagales bacterium]|nr:MAG: phage holin family protein [Cytophagales bacterium]